jgi:hypothetical protein
LPFWNDLIAASRRNLIVIDPLVTPSGSPLASSRYNSRGLVNAVYAALSDPNRVDEARSRRLLERFCIRREKRF